MKFTLQDVMTRTDVHRGASQTDSKKQCSRIAANVIHSLDAAHLMLTIAQICNSSKGASATSVDVRHFAMVHDSYATHAADTGRLCSTIKEQLYLTYSQSDILATLESDILANVPVAAKENLPARPALGTLDLTQIRRSHFSFV